MSVKEESLFVPVGSDGDELHVKVFGSGAPVVMIHGAIENGRIFYSASRRGLAPYLARAGFEVYVADMRGRGESRPRLSRRARHGQTAAITEDLPALARLVDERSGGRAQHWLAHSWGGVLQGSFFVRHPEWLARIASWTCFGTKRDITVMSPHKFLAIDILWLRLFPKVASLVGYLPAKALRFGGEDEPRQSLRDSVAWVRAGSAWVDPNDGFDYGAAAKKVKMPPTLHLVGAADEYLGHLVDVSRFARECGLDDKACVTMLSKATGQRHDYGHVDMLTHPEALEDHFPLVLAWLKKHEN